MKKSSGKKFGGDPREIDRNVASEILPFYFAMALVFNTFSFLSVMKDAEAFTATDPMAGNVLLLLLLLVLTSVPKGRGKAVLHVIGSTILMYSGVLKHLAQRRAYRVCEAYHDDHWRWGVVLNVTGAVCMLAISVRTAGKSRSFRRFVACWVAALSLMACWRSSKGAGADAAQKAAGVCTDAPFFEVPEDICGGANLPFVRHSLYVPMSDGVRLAVDIVLPNRWGTTNAQFWKWGGAEELPTFLHLTRYHRSNKRSWLTRVFYLFGMPPSDVFSVRSMHYINAFVPHGYAFVTVDVRGTGASFGSRPLDLIDREILDFKEISDWVKEQKFCNGRIGTGGISYDGITGALMAAQGNINAAALLFAPGDIYEDIAVPGGVPCTGFVDMYGKFTTASENNEPVLDVDNELPKAYKLIMGLALDGVAPVDAAGQWWINDRDFYESYLGMGHSPEHELKAAVAEHRDNFDMVQAIRDPSIMAKDDTLVELDGKRLSFHDVGITEDTFAGLRKHKVKVYSVAGYFDSGSIRSAARLHNQLGPVRSKLTIGPWSHGCRACYTPGAPSTVPQYDLFADVKRFFDCELKGACGVKYHENGTVKDGGMRKEAPVHYFVSGVDEWRTAPDTWPPAGAISCAYDLAAVSNGGALWPSAEAAGSAAAKDDAGAVEYKVHSNSTSGVVSRWNLVQHLMKQAVTYPNRASEAGTSLVFTTQRDGADAQEAITIVGSPRVRLELELLEPDAVDAVVFAYLEDIDASGEVSYITEGQVRASHPASLNYNGIEAVRVGHFDEAKRTFQRADMAPLKSRTPSTVEFMLEPVAYTLLPGHQLSLSLAGADKDNFLLENIPDLARSWRIHTAGSSRLFLPVQR